MGLPPTVTIGGVGNRACSPSRARRTWMGSSGGTIGRMSGAASRYAGGRYSGHRPMGSMMWWSTSMIAIPVSHGASGSGAGERVLAARVVVRGEGDCLDAHPLVQARRGPLGEVDDDLSTAGTSLRRSRPSGCSASLGLPEFPAASSTGRGKFIASCTSSRASGRLKSCSWKNESFYVSATRREMITLKAAKSGPALGDVVPWPRRAGTGTADSKARARPPDARILSVWPVGGCGNSSRNPYQPVVPMG